MGGDGTFDGYIYVQYFRSYERAVTLVFDLEFTSSFLPWRASTPRQKLLQRFSRDLLGWSSYCRDYKIFLLKKSGLRKNKKADLCDPRQKRPQSTLY